MEHEARAKESSSAIHIGAVHFTTSAADFSKETMVVKEEGAYDAGVFERVEAILTHHNHTTNKYTKHKI